MKRNKTFTECDDTRGWGQDPDDERDHRLCKHLREHQRNISTMPMPDQFVVGSIVSMPQTMLTDLDAPKPKNVPTVVDRGDVYEAFWRTSELTLRGVFVNGEPVWGEAEYANGMSYTGSLRGGRPHGFGVKRMDGSV
ncbi:hypothetical protein T484DRAFT_1757658 [Baffinella frigidus]|nr:hypothetical protein T484DRAFT_1757658 [Cryptophyta sp. CCMP2293]